MKRLYIFTILLFLFALTGNAQQDTYNWRLGLYSGDMGYYGDLNSRTINPQTQWLANPPQNFRPSFGLSLERNVNAQFGLKALWSNGRFTSNDRQVSLGNILQTDAENFTRALNARTHINDFNLIGSLYLERKRGFNKRLQFSPYLMLGVGLTNFQVYGDLFYENDKRYYYWSDFTIRNHLESASPPVEGTLTVLQDGNYETNLTELNTEGKDYSTSVGNIPFGLGFKFRLGERLNINLETLLHYTFTDYLDDVSGVYPILDDPTPLQTYASNPNRQQNAWRGREDDRFNDVYTFSTISLQYSFGYKTGATRPPIEFANADNAGKTIYESNTVVLNEQGDTLRIESQTRIEDPAEAARIRELDEEKAAIEAEIAMLEKELGEEVVAETEPSRRDRRRNKRDKNETPKTPIDEPEIPDVEIVSEEPEPDTPDVAIEEPRRKRPDRRGDRNGEDTMEEPEAPTIEEEMADSEIPEIEIVVEPEIVMEEGDRPARPNKPDISLGGEMPEIEIVTEPEIPGGVVVEIDEPASEDVEEEGRRNRKRDKVIDVTIGEPDEPSVEIVVGDAEPEMPEEVTIEQPEKPAIEVEIETPDEPVVEIEVETEMPEEVAIEVPTTRRDRKRNRRDRNSEEIEVTIGGEDSPIEVVIETPDEPNVEIEVEIETPDKPVVEVEVETPSQPEVAIKTPNKPKVERPKITDTTAEEDDRSVLNPNIPNPAGISFASTQDAIKAYEGFSIFFEDEAYYVAKDLYDDLDGLVTTLHRYPALVITLQGHTAETPSISHFHQEITRKRVYYIQNYLVTKGIALDRIILSFLDAPVNITDLNKQQVHTILK